MSVSLTSPTENHDIEGSSEINESHDGKGTGVDLVDVVVNGSDSARG